jgi:cytochrome c556
VGGAEPTDREMVPVDAETARQLMAERQANYKKIGDAMKLVTRQLRSGSPDLGEAFARGLHHRHSRADGSELVSAGTGAEIGKTGALEVIWQRPEDFEAKARDFEQAANSIQGRGAGKRPCGHAQRARRARQELQGVPRPLS